MPGQDNNPSANIPPEFLDNLQLQDDIKFVKKLLPHYVVQESEKKGSIHCKSTLGGISESPEFIWQGVFNRIKEHFGDRFQEVFHNTCANHCDFTIYLKNDRPGLLEQLQKPHVAQYPRTKEEAFKLVDKLGKENDGEMELFIKTSHRELIKKEDLVPEITALMREADKKFESVGGSTRHYVRDVLLPLMEQKGLCFCKIIK